MSCGHQRDSALPRDDAIGPALLRPAPGFAAVTGSISGSVRRDGEPVPFVAISALRFDGAVFAAVAAACGDGGGTAPTIVTNRPPALSISFLTTPGWGRDRLVFGTGS